MVADPSTVADSSAGFSPSGEAPGLPNAAETLTMLGSAELGEAARRRLIIDVESVSFSDDQKAQLCSAMRAFIDQHRDSQNLDDLVAVAAAVRKLIASIAPGDLGILASLLDPGHRAPVALEIEIEITKMVAWRLSLAPPQPGSMRELAERLLDLARLYLHDRLLPRKGYAATALNAVVALVLLRYHVDEIIATLQCLRLNWFKQLVVRRLASLQNELEHRFPQSEAADSFAALDRVISRLSATTAA